MKKILFFIFLLIILFSSFAFSQEDVVIKSEVDKSTITIGDRIKYSVIIEHNPEIVVEYPALAENLGAFEVKDYKILKPKKIKGGVIQNTTEYIITTFTTGEYTIPSLSVKYTDKLGKNQEVRSEEIKIIVKSIGLEESDSADIRDLKQPATISVKRRFIMVMILIIVLLAGGIFYYIYIQNKESRALSLPPEPLRDPKEIALEEIDKLIHEELIKKGQIKQYYTRISDILRKYIEGRLRIFALDRTTWELYQEIKYNKDIERKQVDIIKELLEECDLVKFAKYIPQNKEINNIHNKAVNFINETSPDESITEQNKKQNN